MFDKVGGCVNVWSFGKGVCVKFRRMRAVTECDGNKNQSASVGGSYVMSGT